jgi:hypothetical protein
VRESNWVCPHTIGTAKNAVGGGRSGVVVDVPIGGCGCVVDGDLISQGRDQSGPTGPATFAALR